MKWAHILPNLKRNSYSLGFQLELIFNRFLKALFIFGTYESSKLNRKFFFYVSNPFCLFYFLGPFRKKEEEITEVSLIGSSFIKIVGALNSRGTKNWKWMTYLHYLLLKRNLVFIFTFVGYLEFNFYLKNLAIYSFSRK